jgi:phosphoribosylanthranilate isomerase
MKFKVCGMKYADNIFEVSKLSPDFMGFIFYPKSKRFVGEDFVMPEIPFSIKKVGVFVNESIENILEKTKKYKLDFVQLHGDDFKLLGSCKIIKAFGLPCHSEQSEESFSFNFLNDFANSCEYFLFDTKTVNYGGSGQSFDKSILQSYKLQKPFFISGGIDLAASAKLKKLDPNPLALDVNSKFETEPAVKEINKLKILKYELSSKW